MKKKLLIIGASGHGKVVADIAIKMNKWKAISFLDDNINIEPPLGLDVIGTTNDYYKYVDNYEMFVGIGNNLTRKKIFEILEKTGANIPVLIHPNAVIGQQVDIGQGTVVMAGAIINSYTRVGKGCIVNTGSTIDHDNKIGDFVHISPGAHLAGTVSVGNCSWLGIGSIVSNNIKITNDCIIGAGAVVVKDLNKSGVYVGVPVRRI
jgi:sugar O-acyltransferase (sialic acid O-acetyltransferase NeuD family)